VQSQVVESASRVEKLLRLSDNAEAYDTLSIPVLSPLHPSCSTPAALLVSLFFSYLFTCEEDPAV
jgi:hypothetical protein